MPVATERVAQKCHSRLVVPENVSAAQNKQVPSPHSHFLRHQCHISDKFQDESRDGSDSLWLVMTGYDICIASGSCSRWISECLGDRERLRSLFRGNSRQNSFICCADASSCSVRLCGIATVAAMPLRNVDKAPSRPGVTDDQVMCQS